MLASASFFSARLIRPDLISDLSEKWKKKKKAEKHRDLFLFLQQEMKSTQIKRIGWTVTLPPDRAATLWTLQDSQQNLVWITFPGPSLYSLCVKVGHHLSPHTQITPARPTPHWPAGAHDEKSGSQSHHDNMGKSQISPDLYFFIQTWEKSLSQGSLPSPGAKSYFPLLILGGLFFFFFFGFWGEKTFLTFQKVVKNSLQSPHTYPETVSKRGDGSLHSQPGMKGVMRSLAGIWGWRQEGL